MTAEARNEFFLPNKDRLEHMAFRATKRGLKPEEFVAVAIDVDDPSWTGVVRELMPNATEEYWQAYRDRGETPVARGTAMAEGLIEYLAEVCPDIAPALLGSLPEGTVRAIIMADGGASVYYIEPFPHFKDS